MKNSISQWSRVSTRNYYYVAIAFVFALFTKADMSAQCIPADGTIQGIVFSDVNNDGVKDADEIGLSGVLVRVHGSDGSELGTSTTDNHGAFAISGLINGQKVRILFSYSNELYPSRFGKDNATSVQFATVPQCNIGLGLISDADLCNSKTEILTTCFVQGTVTERPNMPTIVGIPYGFNSATPARKFAMHGETGSIWGLAYKSRTKEIFSSALVKQYSGLKAGHDAIFKSTFNGTMYVTSLYTRLGDLGQSVGTLSITDVADCDYGKQVGKIGLGAIVISPDEKFLYVVNIYNNTLVRIPTVNPTAANTVAYQIPGTDIHAFALKYHNDKIYVGTTEPGKFVYVWEFDPATGSFTDTGVSTYAGNDWETIPVVGGAPAHWLTDIDFTDNGDMLLSLSDRLGHAYCNDITNRLDDQHGDLLIAHKNPGGGWTMENRAEGEFFSDDYWIANPTYHPEITTGSILALPGTGSVVSTVFDPEINSYSGGLHRYSTITGKKQAGKELYTRETVALFGKATGFGDIIPLCGIPEIEIGNLVWIDTNENGIQDADEAGVAGLPIELRDENCDVIATTTTDSKGNYLFNSSNVTDGLYGNTQYYVGIAPSIIDAGTGLYAIDGKLYNLSLSNPSFPAINSDGGSVAGCSEASISVVTDYTSHLFDLGLIEGSDCRIKITKNALNGPGVKYTDLAVFEIKIRNNGNQPVSDIELEDVFPPTYVFVQATNPEWTANGNKLKTTLTGILGPKSERTIYLKLNFAAVTPISYIYTNHVKVIAIKDASGRAIPDIGVCAEGVNDLSSMSFPNICDLALIHKVDKEVITVPDYKVNFTTIVCNQGTNNATGFTVVNYLNPEFLFNPADNPGWTISDDGTKLFYTVHSTLIPSDCKYIKLALIVKDPKRVEKIINYAEIAESACGSVIADFDSTPDTDPDNDNGAEPFTFTDNLITSHGETDEDDHDVAVVNFHYVDLNIQKVTRVRRANPGDEVKFNIKVTNIGRTPISKIKLVDYLPNHMILHDKEWISVSGNAEKTIVFDPALQPGQSYPTTITVLIDKQAEPPILLTNNIEINEIYDDLGNDVSDPNKKLGELPDGGGSGSESDDIYEDDVAEAALAVITPLEVNPCVSCIQGTTPTNGQFVTTMKLESLSGETWTVESSVGLYDAGSAAPPAAPTPLVDGFVLTEVPIVSRPGFSEYRLTAIHLDGQGFSIRVTNEYGDLEQTSRSGGVCRFDKLAINGIQSLCRGTITEYTVTGAPAGTLFTWYIDDAEVLGVTDDEHEIDWSSYADGEHTIKVIINSDCVTPAELTIAIGEADRSAISCHGTIQVSLDGNCSKTITPQMLAAGTLHSNYPYIVTLTDAEGNVIPNATLTKVHIGTMVMATLLEGCGGNSCWTNIVVEDKTPPVSICQDITLPCYKIDEYEGPFETDNCGGKITNKIVEETYTALECDPDYIAFIDRSYRAVDQYGNESPVCRMRIRVARPDLSLIKWPESFQTSAGTALQCNTFELNDEGHPDISVTGIPYIANVPMYPSIPGLCNLSVGYVDRDLGYIKCTRKIIRTWYVYEQWCSSTDFIKFDQMLEIVDKTAPIIAPIEDFSVTVNGNKICEADIQLPQAVVTDDCNNQGLTVTVTYPGGFIDNFDGTQKIRLGLGDHIITYRAYDLCKNSSSVSFIVSVIDETPPVMACKGIVVVGLNSLGVADLYPRHIDDGSYDGCGIDYFDVARMPEQGPVVDSLFGPFVTFNCADVGKENIVILRAWDISGNNNSCMMTVEVQDKHAPKIACPADLTIDCSEVFDGMDLTQYGSATAIDVCGAEVAELNPEFSLNACRVGTILRHFTASDNANTVMCTQTITVENNYDFDPEKHVIKPQDYIVTNNACSVEDLKPENLPDGYGAPVITQTPCSLAAASYKDEIFDIVTGACYKILRTWTVIDWCEMEAAGSNYVPYKFQQTIMVNNTIPPIFVDQEPIDTTFYTDKGVCDKGRVRLTFVGRDDCTPDNKLKWSYYLDYFDEGVETVTNIGSGPIASLDADLPVGTHRILWSFEDQCGNIVTKGHLVTVVNNDAPQAVALDSIAVAIVPCDTDGDGLPDLEKGCITAESLNVSSSSLCCTDPLIFSFSEDITDTVRCFTCLDVNYPTFVELWVTDCNGNTDKVIVEVDVQDNNDSDICEKICENFPAVAVISGVDEVCIGEEVTLTASGGGTYHWSTGATTPSITVQPNTTTTYSVTVTNEYRCTDSESITVTVHQLPVISIAGEDICLGESTTLTASGGSTYIWSTGETTPSITVSPLDTTTYSVTATDDNGCEASTSREVIVFPLPEPEITGNMFICVGSSTTLTASGGVSYVWSTGESTPSITVSPSTTTTYSVTVTNDFGCTASTSKTVTVNGIALQASINGDDVICSGESTTLQAQLNGGNPVSYAWNTGATSSTITVSPSSNTTYVVTITDINGCTSSASKLVTVNPLPAVSIDGQDVCLNSSTTLTASGGTSYVWSTGETTPSITVSPLMNTTYTVTATNNFGCTAAASKTVNVLPLPVVTITGDLQICLNEVTTLTASGGVSYVWSTGETTSSIDVSPVVNTTYTVTATDANGCSNTASATVIVNGLSINASITGDDEICLGESTVLTAELSGGTPLSYLWNTGETTASITVNPSVTSTFSVTITDINGCEGRASITVTVHPLPDITIVGDDEICIGTSTTLTASGGVSYLWSTGDSTPEITVSPTNTTTYTVTVTTDFGCTASASITVNVLPLPVVSISGDQEICIGDTTTLTASGGSSYVWSTGETTSSIDVAPVSDTEYTVTATDTNGCSNTASVTVVVHGANLAASITGDDIICVNESTVLSAQLTGGTAATYLWSTGETSESITVNPSVTTSYSVTITDINGCSAEASIDITVNPLPVVIITGGFEVCPGDSTTLTASGGSAYVWSTGETTASITVSPTQNTTYTVTATDQNSCSNTAEATVIILPLPNADISGPDTICSGVATELIASGGVSYEWSTGETGTTITVSPTEATTYVVTVTDDKGCENTASHTVEIFDLINPVITGDSLICIGDFTTLVASGGVSYQWSTGDLFDTVRVAPTSTTTYTVTVTDEHGCTASTSATVLVDTGQFTCETVDITVYLDATGSVTITPSDVSAGVIGACVDVDASVSPSMFNCNDAAAGTPVTVTLTLINLNTDDTLTCTALVTVLDTLPPTLTCPPNVDVSCADFDPDAPLSIYGNASVTDNCPAGLTLDEIVISDLDECNQGMITRTFIGTDVSGNETSCVQLITIENPDPLTIGDITFPADITIDNCTSIDPSVLGSVDLDVDEFVQCDEIVVTYTDNLPSPLCAGSFERLWTVIDSCQLIPGTDAGIWNYTQFVDVVVTPPVISGPDTVTIQRDSLTCIAELKGSTLHTVAGCNNSLFVNGNPVNDFNLNGEYTDGEHDFELVAVSNCDNTLVDTFNFKLIVEGRHDSLHCNKTYPELDDNLEVTDNVYDHVEIFQGCDGMGTIIASFDNINQYDTVRHYTCADLPGAPYLLQVYFWREGASSPYYSCDVLVGLKNEYAPFCTTPPMRISGEVFTENQQAVPGVEVKLDGSEMPLEYTSDSGKYAFPAMGDGGTYDVIPTKDVNPLEGVSTLDLIKIQRHILQIEELNSPYKIIAADINKDEKVTASDISQLRKLILGVYDRFPDNTSWRLIDKNYKFFDPKDPFLGYLPESYHIELFDQSMNIDWVGVKIGDVNNSYSSQAKDNSWQSRSSEISFVIPNQELFTGRNAIPVIASSDESITGFQISIPVQMLSNIAITQGLLALGAENYSFVDNVLNISWHNSEPIEMHAGDVLFYLHADIENSIKAQHLFLTNISRGLKPEYYDGSQAVHKLSWRIDGEETSDLEVYGNTPNPWNNETDIQFYIPEDGEVGLRVTDLTGRIIYSTQGYFRKGENRFILSSHNINVPGLLLYEVRYGDQTKTMKMLNIK